MANRVIRPVEKEVVLKEIGVRLGRVRVAYAEMIHRPRMSVRDFAAVLGVQEERYRTWERGLREIPLWMLIRIKHLTGASVDMLLEGAVSDWDSDISPADATYHKHTILIARHMRWVRELMEPDIEKAAAAMKVVCDRWRRWELGIERPPLDKIAEFAVRFGVTIDFLWSGRPIGLDSNLQAELMQRHVELRPPGYQPPQLPYTRMPGGGDNNSPQSSASECSAA